MSAVAEAWEATDPDFPQLLTLRGVRSIKRLSGGAVVLVDHPVAIYLQPRPHYCDRGHWYGITDGPLNIDQADSFPRYYMDLEVAKRELRAWLVWRLERLGDT